MQANEPTELSVSMLHAKLELEKTLDRLLKNIERIPDGYVITEEDLIDSREDAERKLEFVQEHFCQYDHDGDFDFDSLGFEEYFDYLYEKYYAPQIDDKALLSAWSFYRNWHKWGKK